MPFVLGSSLVPDDIATFIDTRPSLLFAVKVLSKACSRKHLDILDRCDLMSLFNSCRDSIEALSLSIEDEDEDEEEAIQKFLGLFIREFQAILDSSESMNKSMQKDQILALKEKWIPFLVLLVYLSILRELVPEVGESSPSKRQFSVLVTQKLLPLTCKFWLFANSTNGDMILFVPESSENLLKYTWSLLSTCLDLDFYSCMGPAVSILARHLRIYFPWSDEDMVNTSLFERFGFDLRGKLLFVRLFQAGLSAKGPSSSSVRKEALLILRQTVKFSRSYLYASSDQYSNAEATLFFWEAKDVDTWVVKWQEFFLLYGSVQETQVHISQPMMPLLKKLLIRERISLDFIWWQIILQRAINSDSANVKRFVLESVLEIDLNDDQYSLLRQQNGFIFGELMQALDQTSLFTKSAGDMTASHVSVLGMKLAAFYASYISCQVGLDKAEAINDYIRAVLDNVQTSTPCLFFVQALLLLQPDSLLDRSCLERLKSLVKSDNLFQNPKSRKLIRWQLLHVFVSLANTSALAFHDIASFLREVTNERLNSFTIDSDDYQAVNEWLNANFNQDYIAQNIHLAVTQVFDDNGQSTFEQLEAKCEEIAIMLCLTISRGGRFAQCIRPLYQQMAALALVELESSAISVIILLFSKVNDYLVTISKGSANLLSNFDVSTRLYDWIAVIVGALREGHEKLSSLAEAQNLMQGLRLFIQKAIEQPGDLIAYLDIQLYKMVGYLKLFNQMAINDEAEDYNLQILKYTCFDFMDVAFKTLEGIGNFHIAFVNEATLGHVFSTELTKPPHLIDLQFESWNDLMISFTVSKWSLIATISRFSSKSPEMRKIINLEFVFKKCLDALENAQYDSIVAIYDCLGALVNISGNQISAELVEDSFLISKKVLDEFNGAPHWSTLFANSFINYFIQPSLLERLDIADNIDSLAGRVINYILKDLGSNRRHVVAKLSRSLFSYWSTPTGALQMRIFEPLFKDLLIYGPIREDNEDRLAQNLTLTNIQEYSAERQAEISEGFSVGTDHIARAAINSVILALNPAERWVQDFAGNLLDDLLAIK